MTGNIQQRTFVIGQGATLRNSIHMDLQGHSKARTLPKSILGLPVFLLSVMLMLILYTPSDMNIKIPLPYSTFKQHQVLGIGAEHRPSQKAYLAAISQGRQGNEMFIYATLFAMAKKTKRIPYI